MNQKKMPINLILIFTLFYSFSAIATPLAQKNWSGLINFSAEINHKIKTDYNVESVINLKIQENDRIYGNTENGCKIKGLARFERYNPLIASLNMELSQCPNKINNGLYEGSLKVYPETNQTDEVIKISIQSNIFVFEDRRLDHSIVKATLNKNQQ